MPFLVAYQDVIPQQYLMYGAPTGITGTMSNDIHVSVPDYQAEWLDEQGVSASALLQEAIDGRMEVFGFDPEEWEETYGR